jgi:beta-aspartyl-peptidase (threonine type)
MRLTVPDNLPALTVCSLAILLTGCQTTPPVDLTIHQPVDTVVGSSGAKAQAQPQWVLAIHAGAGNLPKDLSSEELGAIRATLYRALDAGSQILTSGGSSVDAVQSAVRVMENSCVLNAGCGAVLDHEGFVELDAAIMDGSNRKAGAVAALRHVANPVDLARQVMEHSKHVLLAGPGAEQFAQERGMTLMPESYFITERRRKELQRAIEAEKGAPQTALPCGSKGTVGAIALDTLGNLAAATSTGGLTNKHFGRVGDSPIVGAGTYAENGVCAVSATGVGEVFIRFTAAADVCARMKYRKQSVEAAASEVIRELKAAGGEGGMIVLSPAGQVAMPYSSQTMLRGQVSSQQPADVVVETRDR